MFIREKYNINPSDEYMKETTAVGQLIQELESNQQAQTALQTTGLNEWFLDLKAKNEAFLAKMNELLCLSWSILPTWTTILLSTCLMLR